MIFNYLFKFLIINNLYLLNKVNYWNIFYNNYENNF